MGVFARLLRRSKATEEAPAAEAPAETAQEAPVTGTETERPATAAAEPEGGAADGTPEPAEPETAGKAGSDGVEIPKQQSAGEAVDNEAGEGART